MIRNKQTKKETFQMRLKQHTGLLPFKTRRSQNVSIDNITGHIPSPVVSNRPLHYLRLSQNASSTPTPHNELLVNFSKQHFLPQRSIGHFIIFPHQAYYYSGPKNSLSYLVITSAGSQLIHSVVTNGFMKLSASFEYPSLSHARKKVELRSRYFLLR